MRTVFRCDDPEVNPYRLLTAVVVPRPIAWVSSLGDDGVGNLAPHSFFSVACASPPIVSFTSVGAKDTLANVLATGEFVVNVATRPLLEQVNSSSAPFGPEIDEAARLGIALEPSDLVAPPRVAASPASIECALHSTLELGTPRSCSAGCSRSPCATTRSSTAARRCPRCSRSRASAATSGGCRPR